MKRFYSSVGVEQTEAGYTITLDGRLVRTPARQPLGVPSRDLADAVADEWAAQEETIKPEIMPFTRIVNAVIDGVAPRRAEVVEGVARYGGSDLLCYRAEFPRELAARQAARWDMLLHWANRDLGLRLKVGKGLMPVEQSEACLEAFRGYFSQMDSFTLAAAHTVASLSGSAVIALALARGHITVDEAWTAARVDEDWQMEQWGEDSEAIARDQIRKRELDVAVELMGFMRKAPARQTEPQALRA